MILNVRIKLCMGAHQNKDCREEKYSAVTRRLSKVPIVVIQRVPNPKGLKGRG